MDHTLTVRDSTDADIPAITRIYAHWVRYGLASFELDPPDEAEMARRRLAIRAAGYPYLVLVDSGAKVLGYAYAGPFRTRPAFRFSCEDSIYVAADCMGAGAGRALLSALLERCETLGFRIMVAVIGDSGNAPSIGLHAALGFQNAGLLPAIGWKHDRWVDSVLMVRPLGPGPESPPKELAMRGQGQ
jgi:phosphinothricin acetyltransferase